MSVLRQCGALFRNTPLISRTVQRYYGIGAAIATKNILLQSRNANAAIARIETRGYKKFGHEEQKIPRITKIFHFTILSIFFLTIMDWRKVRRMITPKVDADAGVKPKEKLSKGKNDHDNSDSESDSDDDSQVDESSKKKKEKIGFRERKIIEYENRIRQYSTPDKIFRYFATVRLSSQHSDEVYMTPDDFLRSIFPGIKQPEGLGLDKYRRYDPKTIIDDLNHHLEKNSIFFKLGSYGLITFSDYIFLLTVLSTSRRHFEIAFQMFDLNGDGDVDCDEFEKVATLARFQTSMGSRHRDHLATGNTFKGVNSALITYFFGPNLDQKLTIEKFLKFQQLLQREMLSLEFARKQPDENGSISETDFAELLLAYAGYPIKRKARKLKRVKRVFRERSLGITRKDYLDFFHFLSNINDVDTALTFYHIAGASIDQATLKHVAKTVAMVDLSDHVIEVVFTIFDENNDGQLSNREFVSVMKDRVQRGLEKSKDTGFLKLMQSMWKCAKETKPVLLNL